MPAMITSQEDHLWRCSSTGTADHREDCSSPTREAADIVKVVEEGKDMHGGQEEAEEY
jgi:hypothetical protein